MIRTCSFNAHIFRHRDPHHFTPRNWVKQAPFDWDPEGLQTAAGNEPPEGQGWGGNDWNMAGKC